MHDSFTIIPAIITPAKIAEKAYRLRMPNTKATAHAVHAPVHGSGIATKGLSV